mmetsp:Transcript_46623/g.83426  ORF Transcript_46623/g.83426 Transcript_46623/m.83426 type:complete len:90 (+) Transcript_46623:7478-7747(+)
MRNKPINQVEAQVLQKMNGYFLPLCSSSVHYTFSVSPQMCFVDVNCSCSDRHYNHHIRRMAVASVTFSHYNQFLYTGRPAILLHGVEII